jgi:hypothetical protein
MANETAKPKSSKPRKPPKTKTKIQAITTVKIAKPPYEAVLVAARSVDKGYFAIGDALIKTCGAPSPTGKNDSSYEKLKEAAAYLLENGIEYDVTTLTRYRMVAHSFPRAVRRTALSWSVHLRAGTPEMLEEVIQALGEKNKSVTPDNVLEYVREKKAKEKEEKEWDDLEGDGGGAEDSGGAEEKKDEKDEREPLTFERLEEFCQEGFEIFRQALEAIATAKKVQIYENEFRLQLKANGRVIKKVGRYMERYGDKDGGPIPSPVIQEVPLLTAAE